MSAVAARHRLGSRSFRSSAAFAWTLGLAGCVLGGVEGDFAPLEAPSEPAATCHDGALNGDERDVDCGGGCSPCGVGQACRAHADCASGLCAGATCAPASCADAAQDGGESDVDCGGPCPGCADGAACATGGDCQSGVCSAGACAPASCGDGLHNGGEIDVDCGGACAPCALGMACTANVDCQSGLCLGGICAPTCSDSILNQTETDVDCGGTLCPACPAGSDCIAANDCTSHVCTAGLCQGSTCSDGNKSGLETDVDCGGPGCAPCANGDACIYGEDCLSGGCASSVCAPWAKAFGPHTSSPFNVPVALSVDAAGDIAFASNYDAGVDFGGGVLTGFTTFLAKLSRTGAHLWSRSVGYGFADDVASDGSGNVYLAGGGYGTDMGCGPYSEFGGGDAVIAKYHAVTGACLWHRHFHTPYGDVITRIAVAPNGDVVVAGWFGPGTFQVGTFTLTNSNSPSPGIYRHFVAKLDAGGMVLWAKDIGGDELFPTLLGGIALDPNGAIIVSRAMSNLGAPGTIDFGQPCSPLSPNDASDIYIAKLDAAGACLWAQAYSTGFDDWTHDVATDASGNVLWLGASGGNLVLGGPAVTGLVVAKLSGAGIQQWSRGLQVVAGSDLMEIAPDPAGNAVIVGSFSFDANFGNGLVPNKSTVTSCYACRDVFVAKYAAASGNHLFSTTYGVDAPDYAFDAAVHPSTGNVVVTGAFEQTLDLGAPLPLIPVSPSSAFVLSMGRLP